MIRFEIFPGIWIIMFNRVYCLEKLLFLISTHDSLFVCRSNHYQRYFLAGSVGSFSLSRMHETGYLIDHWRQTLIAGFWQRFYQDGYRFYPTRWKNPCFDSLIFELRTFCTREKLKNKLTNREYLGLQYILYQPLQAGTPSSIEIQRFQTCGE